MYKQREQTKRIGRTCVREGSVSSKKKALALMQSVKKQSVIELSRQALAVMTPR